MFIKDGEIVFEAGGRLGTFISLVTLDRGKLKAAFCPSVSLGKLSSGQVVPAAPRPTDSEPCGCPDSLPKRCLGNFLVRSGSFWVFHARCLGRTLSMALTFATNEFVLLAISGNGETVFSHKFPACFDRRCCATCYEAPCYGLKKDLEVRNFIEHHNTISNDISY